MTITGCRELTYFSYLAAHRLPSVTANDFQSFPNTIIGALHDQHLVYCQQLNVHQEQNFCFNRHAETVFNLAQTKGLCQMDNKTLCQILEEKIYNKSIYGSTP
jgi:hypothetical protein